MKKPFGQTSHNSCPILWQDRVDTTRRHCFILRGLEARIVGTTALDYVPFMTSISVGDIKSDESLKYMNNNSEDVEI